MYNEYPYRLSLPQRIKSNYLLRQWMTTSDNKFRGLQSLNSELHFLLVWQWHYAAVVCGYFFPRSLHLTPPTPQFLGHYATQYSGALMSCEVTHFIFQQFNAHTKYLNSFAEKFRKVYFAVLLLFSFTSLSFFCAV